MRYFLFEGAVRDRHRPGLLGQESAALAMPALSLGVVQAARACGPVTAPRFAQRLGAGLACAAIEAIDVAVVAVATQDHLSVTPGTVI